MRNTTNNASADLMNDLRLRTARRRLADSASHDDAIEGLREIVANFLGCEEMGIFKVDPRNAGFQLSWSFGVELELYDLGRILGDHGRERVMRGECHVDFAVASTSGGIGKMQAFVPMRVGGKTVAVLALLRLLPQKSGFDKSDTELFSLLTEEAGHVLFGRETQEAARNKGVASGL
jgi:hypothetical protein